MTLPHELPADAVSPSGDLPTLETTGDSNTVPVGYTSKSGEAVSDDMPFDPMVPEDKGTEVTRTDLVDGKYILSRIDEGQIITVGGNLIDSRVKFQLRADFENFAQFFQDYDEQLARINLDGLEDWLGQAGLPVDPKLFSQLFTFTSAFSSQFPRTAQPSEEREQLYQRDNTQSLSTIMEHRVQECAEIATLAQGVLQKQVVDSKLISGDVLWREGEEFSEEHSYLLIRSGDDVFIYDPTNPTTRDGATWPSIYIVPQDFESFIKMHPRKAFVPAHNIMSNKVAYFGVNNGTNVRPEHILVSA